jgi:hypothetical protein
MRPVRVSTARPKRRPTFKENLVSLFDEVGLIEASFLGEVKKEVTAGDSDGDPVGEHELAANHYVFTPGHPEPGGDVSSGGLGSDLEHATSGCDALVLGLAEEEGLAGPDPRLGGDGSFDYDPCAWGGSGRSGLGLVVKLSDPARGDAEYLGYLGLSETGGPELRNDLPA